MRTVRAAFKSRLFMVLVAGTLTGCLGTSPPARFFLLTTPAQDGEATGMAPSRTVTVAAVELPDYLDRDNIVSRESGSPRLLFNEQDIWAEPLSSMITRSVARTISAVRSDLRAVPSSLIMDRRSDLTIRISFSELEAVLPDRVSASALWFIETAAGSGGPIRSFHATESLPEGPGSVEARVTAISRLVERLAESIAREIEVKGGRSVFRS